MGLPDVCTRHYALWFAAAAWTLNSFFLEAQKNLKKGTAHKCGKGWEAKMGWNEVIMGNERDEASNNTTMI